MPRKRGPFGTNNPWGRGQKRTAMGRDPRFDPKRKYDPKTLVPGKTIIKQRALRRPWGPRNYLYLLVGQEPYVRMFDNPEGKESYVWLWESVCAVCGCKFICKSGPKVGVALRRTCDEHDYTRGRPMRWITDGVSERQIRRTTPIRDGWHEGRKE